ncbi:MAG: hypothetical protein Q8P20_06375 [bacterium]|nr:hypothetical protein [bacterium]
MTGYVTIIITIPLVLYTMGMYKSRRYNFRGAVKCFGWGIAFDYPTTVLMNILAGKFTLSAHTVVGLVAIIMITIDLIIGLTMLKKNKPELERWFRNGALISWLVWVTSYVIGFIMHCPWIK